MASTTRNRERISWLALEGLLIIVSILLAFSIDAWWGGLQEEEQLAGALSELVPAFSDNVEILEENIELVEQSKNLVQRFVRLSPEEFADARPVEAVEMLEAMWRKNTIDDRDAYIDAILISERMNSLSDPELQAALRTWQGMHEEFADVDSLLTVVANDAFSALADHQQYAVSLSQDPSERRPTF